MNISQDSNSAEYIINKYEPGKIWINQQIYQSSVLITPNTLDPKWRPQVFEDITQDDFSKVLEFKPEVFLLGTGQESYFLNPSWLEVFSSLGIGIEMMDSLRTIYTYTVLSCENRKVMAGIIIT